jgi:hypothetical protein
MDDMDRNESLNHYFKEIKSMFPTFGKQEKAYISELRNEAEDYAESVSDCSYTKLVAQFGEPNTVISEYFAKIDFRHLIKRLRIAKYIKICMVIAVTLALIAGSIRIGFYYKGYLEAKDAYLHTSESKIKEFQGED